MRAIIPPGHRGGGGWGSEEEKEDERSLMKHLRRYGRTRCRVAMRVCRGVTVCAWVDAWVSLGVSVCVCLLAHVCACACPCVRVRMHLCERERESECVWGVCACVRAFVSRVSLKTSSHPFLFLSSNERREMVEKMYQSASPCAANGSSIPPVISLTIVNGVCHRQGECACFGSFLK